LLILMFALIPRTFAQEVDEKKQIWENFLFSGYVDAYYAVYTDSLDVNQLQQLSTVSPRSKRFGLNVAQLGIHYEDEKVRGNIVLHYGDIAKATWDPDFPMIQEANVGIELKDGWWLDGGFFTTHIGTEGFLPKDNYTSSTAVATYNEPFFQSGVRISYEGKERFDFQLWVLNGYNYFLDANDAKSIGVLLSYQFKENLQLTYTNLLGRESPDGLDTKQYRTYHNLYMNYNPTSKLHFILGGDLGTQSHSQLDHPGKTAIMYNALLTARYQFNMTYSVTGRAEIFQDPDGAISGTYANADSEEAGLEMTGYTLSTEYRPTPKSYIRMEVRYIHMMDRLGIFYDNRPTDQRIEGMVTIGVEF